MKVKHLLHCHLMLPAARLSALAAARPLPALKKLLNWSQASAIAPFGAEAWLCQQFGLMPQDAPTAPLAALGAGLNPGGDYWLHADPAYVHLLRDRIILTDEAFADLAGDEAEAMVVALNRHFADEDMTFVAVGHRWFLRLKSPAAIKTSLRETALNADIQQHLPTGPDAMRWHQRLNEIQMLLHGHPVNQSREDRSALPVNSLWLSGGGVLPPMPDALFSAVWSDDMLANGLAAASGCPGFSRPASAEAWLAQGHAGVALIHPEMTDAIERDWFSPLVDALKAGKLQSLTLHITSPRQVQSLYIPRTQCWKFWRRTNPLDFAIHD